MRIVIMGAGGLGGYFGARLAAAGNDVAFVARGAHLAAIREHGLRVESARGDLHLRDVTATDDPAALAQADVVMIAVKLWDTEAAAEAVKPLLRPGTAVVSFQNGVSKDEVLTRILGREAVIGGVGQIGVVIASPGVIRHIGTMAKLSSVNSTTCGPRASRRCWTPARRLASTPRSLMISTWRSGRSSPSWCRCLPAPPACAPASPIRANPQTRAFLLDITREVVAVSQALGVRLADDFAEERMRFVETLPPQMTASMQGDLARGNRLSCPGERGPSNSADELVCRRRSIVRSRTFWRSTSMAHQT